jgi:hypothetical protein
MAAESLILPVLSDERVFQALAKSTKVNAS